MDKADLDVVKHFFSHIEYEELMALHEPMRTKHFFDLRILKESYMK